MIKEEIPKNRLVEFTQVLDVVESIVNQVRQNGDKAIIDLTKKFDSVELKDLSFSKDEIEQQASLLSDDLRRAVDVIYEQLKEFHLTLMPPEVGGGKSGVEFGIVWKPIETVGIYVPGGKQKYPSTLLMAGIPAKIAGVREIYFSTPQYDKLDPMMAYICQKLGIKQAYRIGGAQAIAAMAYGTESVHKVSKIVGPGNIYVQAAKYIVSREVGIDGIEGPTELVIIADDSADPRRVATDLLAQGEHGKSSLLVLISTSGRLISKVKELLSTDVNDFYIVEVKSVEEALKISDELSPEHLSLQVRSPRSTMKLVRNAGAITLGNTPPAMVDYGAGPDHILPTNGWSKFRGGITVLDFIKPISYTNLDNPTKELIDASIKIAKYEGFEIHGKSIGIRYE
ncbi:MULTISPECIES: histidinol dehydrogenase [Acidianus]|uniref:Histidinol dehydrogenase n=1 Tax=Candidatus Acidianus copahuensis TaxID=1160895 RepID=A0A031LTF0_9CREN|nr:MULTISPECIES: histidinol dehydrogenase [Acidianus]EZQ11030.1 histidinol dehydrogenase [Candidatus Acidianus copahuensis]NON62605.1 histidinol dehydrogenase [Acidianus sp. RZ1]